MERRNIEKVCIQPYGPTPHLVLQLGHFQLLFQYLPWAQGCSLLGRLQALLLGQRLVTGYLLGLRGQNGLFTKGMGQ